MLFAFYENIFQTTIGESNRVYAYLDPQVIDETLSPTWDELLSFEEILVYGRREDIKANPPTIIIEIYDQDKVANTSHLLKQ